MTRPFIEFIQTQWLNWTDRLSDVCPPWREKVLTVDGDSGATTRLIWLPPSWFVTAPCHLTAAEEFLVLAGTVHLNGVEYRHLGYGNLPAGLTREQWWTGSGAQLLAFSHATPELRSGTGDIGEATHLDPYDADWIEIDYRPKMAPGARKLPLRTDPDTGEATWLLGAAPIRHGRLPERHPVTEETFVIDGWSIGPLGSMGPGAYFCRPPDIWHGPFGTPASGKLNIVRSIGGPLSTEYDEGNAVDEFDWDPEYRPVLPPELASIAALYAGNAQHHRLGGD